MTNTSTYGKYNTPLTTIEHSAIASWSGFLYQGLCALHYALSLLRTDWDGSKTKKLNLEGFEDFAILDSDSKIISFHQCKCYKKSTDLSKECKKMSDKYEYWENIKKRLSPKYDRIYIHTNQTNTYDCGITSYHYNTANGVCSSIEIFELIKNELSAIIKERNLPGSHLTKASRLISILVKHVEMLHEMSIASNQDMFDIACDNSIPFSKLTEAIETDTDSLNIEERAYTFRYYIILEMKERQQTYPHIKGTKVEDFLKDLDQLNDDNLIQFLYRIFPDVNMLSSDINDIAIRSTERANNLFNVINEVDDSIDSKEIHWITDVGTKHTPSTLGSDKYPEEFCVNIVNNPYSSELRRDFRWIVGDVKYKVEDIDKAANLITMVDTKDYTDITQPNKVGILDIKSKNNGNF